jgi:hypothetical protein
VNINFNNSSGKYHLVANEGALAPGVVEFITGKNAGADSSREVIFNVRFLLKIRCEAPSLSHTRVSNPS